MEITLDLKPEAYQVAEELATERRQSVAEFVNDVILRQRNDPPQQLAMIGVDDQGFPQIHAGQPVTPEEIKEMIAEDEEWEITRGNPYHPWYAVDPDRIVFSEGYPRVVDGPMGLPEVQLGPSAHEAGKSVGKAA